MSITLSGSTYASMLRGGASCLNLNRQTVNDLNVFPVPDGDTGDNMYMTINAGAERTRDGGPLYETARIAEKCMLLGARGNSGVILSRIFAGISKGFDGVSIAQAEDVARAFEKGVDESYHAVSNPVDGTILSVFRDAVRYANSKIYEKNDLSEYFSDLIFEAQNSLERTPDQLPVLKEAGVVDSGGAGIVYIFCGMKDALDGKTALASNTSIAAKQVDTSAFNEDSVLTYGYCTEFLLQLQRCKVDVEHFDESVISEYLNSVGNSVVFFRDGSVIKVHVHTMHPGEILNHCQQYGEYLTLKIENMTLQHNETDVKNTYKPPERKKRYGVVAVASGDGVKKLFTDLGADCVVDGGQSMNPAAEDFVKAYESIKAEDIFVFPNNKNIILAAEQSAELYGGAKIHVVKSKSIGEGYMGLSALDLSEKNVDALLSTVEQAMCEVECCCVSKASRDALVDDVAVHKGDFIGFSDKTVYSDAEGKNAAAKALLEKADAMHRDVILVIFGADTAEDEADALIADISPSFKRSEIIKIYGGQQIYDYIFILE